MTKATPLLALATSAVLGAACGSMAKSDTAGEGAAGAADDATPASGDSGLAARKRLENPGGMWMPRQMLDHARQLENLGLEIEASALSDPTRPPLSAVVSLGGCTASFVSPEGLVVTNHHCVRSALQLNSTAEDNLVENGFLAASRDKERWAGPTQRIKVAQKMTDLSAAMTGGLAEIADPAKRHEELEKREKHALAECEKGRPEVRCEVRSFFGGKEWQLIEFLEIRDVRLVYAPHRAIGNYGGEIDNWAWPRHTGDFSFYRAYVGKDGKPADHSPENVPYRPATHLKVQPAGVAAHDLVFVTGYPARTNRHLTAAEMKHAAEWTHPRYVEKAKQKMAVLAEVQKVGGETAIKATVARLGTQNGLEKYQGILEGVATHELLPAKAEAEKKLRAWAAADGSRRRYIDALDRMEALEAGMWKAEAEEETWKDAAVAGSGLLGQALFLVKWSHEQAKPDLERDLGYQERDRRIVVGAQKAFAKRFDPSVDRALWKLMLGRAAADPGSKSWLPALLRLPAGRAVDEAAIDKALDRFYSATRLADEKVRMKLLASTPAQLAKSRDPFVVAALQLYPRVEEIEKRDEAWEAEMVLLRPIYMEGLLAHAGGHIAPDANGSLRISFGTVRGYRPAANKPVYNPFTAAVEIPRKNTGKDPFDAPKKLLEAVAAGKWGAYAAPDLGSVPVAFLSDLDISGGNSGSPVLNARGELVGLAFDGNYEGLSSDVVFRGDSTRTISVDIRYVLWVADAVDQADHLVKELGLEPSL
jgi:V8-like Glu-specific endopeptidase